MIKIFEAGDHPEAAGVETNAPITVEDLQEQRRLVERQMKTVQEQKAADLKRKLSQRETLIREMPGLDKLLEETQKALDYFGSLDKSGLLTDELRLGFEKTKLSLAELMQQQKQALEMQNLLMRQPEIHAAVRGEAETENKDRIFNRDLETAQKELHKRVDDLVESSRPLADRQEELSKKQRILDAKLSQANTGAGSIIDQARQSVQSAKYYGEDLVPDKPNEETYLQYLARLQDLKEKLPFWGSGEKKKALGAVLKPENQEAFNAADAAKEQMQAWNTEQLTLEGEIKTLAELYREIMLGAWRKQKEIEATYPRQTKGKRLDFARNVYGRFDERLRELGDVERYDHVKGKTIPGKYKDLSAAIDGNPSLSRHSGMVARVKREGGDYDLVYKEPEELGMVA